MFEGFRSRWSKPLPWMYPTAWAIVSTSPAATRGGKGLFQPLLEAASGDVLEDEEEPSVCLAVIVERHDVGWRMLETARASAEPPTTGGRNSVGADGTRKDLERDQTIQARLGGQVDHPHRTPT